MLRNPPPIPFHPEKSSKKQEEDKDATNYKTFDITVEEDKEIEKKVWIFEKALPKIGSSGSSNLKSYRKSSKT